jgi:hypothetical protein
MVVVAVVSVILGAWKAKQRWTIFEILADRHDQLAEMYREDQMFFKVHPEIDELDPEPPPLSPWDTRSFQPEGRSLQADYHEKMYRYWKTRW